MANMSPRLPGQNTLRAPLTVALGEGGEAAKAAIVAIREALIAADGSIAEAAERLEVSRWTAIEWLKRPELEAVRLEAEALRAKTLPEKRRQIAAEARAARKR